MLSTRILTALALVPLVLAALFLLPPRGLGIALLVVTFIAAREWSQLAAFPVATQRLFIGGILVAGIALLALPAFGFDRGWPTAVVLAGCGLSGLFWLLVAPAWVTQRWPTSGRGPMFVVGWIVLLGGWMALVELQARSPWLVLAAMAIVWIADTAAYFAGRAFGRRKLAPAISPGKTWEGVYGALAAVALYALLLLTLAPPTGLASALDAPVIVASIACALLITGISVIGDLFESLMKRHAGVKDSGNLLPGHGGVLDRIDALLAAMPLAALAAHVFMAKA
jgi:phosphatidate cytidylyltransferase